MYSLQCVLRKVASTGSGRVLVEITQNDGPAAVRIFPASVRASYCLLRVGLKISLAIPEAVIQLPKARRNLETTHKH